MVNKQEIIAHILREARAYGVDPAFALSVFEHESGLRQFDAKGNVLLGPPIKGASYKAMGVAQLIPATAKRYGVTDAGDYQQNITAGVKYLRDLVKQRGSYELALKSYGGFTTPKSASLFPAYVGGIRKRYEKFIKHVTPVGRLSSIPVLYQFTITITQADMKHLRGG